MEPSAAKEEEASGFFASDFQVSIKSIPSQFYDNANRPLACKIGVVQICKTELSLWPGGLPTDRWLMGRLNKNWHLDGGIPYTGRSIDPTKRLGSQGVGDSFIYNDVPGIGASIVFPAQGPDGHLPNSKSSVQFYAQWTEFHVVALEGKEKGAVYGGFYWWQIFMQKPSGGYNVVRRAFPITTPSGTFKRIVGPML